MADKKIKVMTSGVFDILNLGHINILSQAKNMGNHLVCGIQNDDSVKNSKGNFPILNINERKQQIKALGFVDEIIIYDNVDQRELWDTVKPNIIVQGDDYLYSSDREKAIEYLKEKNIRLILLPRTENISSSIIKKRIIDNQRRDDLVLNSLKLFKINDLNRYENIDPARVDKIVKLMKVNPILKNPILVGDYDDKKIIVDGNNRVEALRKLNIEYVVGFLIPYEKIDLKPNMQYIFENKTYRLSEFYQPENQKQIKFKQRSHSDIKKLITNNEQIPSGETWHIPPYNIININIELKQLNKNFNLTQFINDLSINQRVRFYSNNTYVCDDY